MTECTSMDWSALGHTAYDLENDDAIQSTASDLLISLKRSDAKLWIT